MLRYILYIKKKFFSNKKNLNFVKNNSKIKNIIVSHLVNYENLSFANDFYFGSLAKKLDINKTIIVLIDHINFKKKLKNRIKNNYIILSKNINFINELKLHIELLFLFLFKKKENFRECINSIDHRRICYQVLKIISKYKIQNLLLTFEGNEYEKLIISKIRKKNYKIQISGFQFSVIKKKQKFFFANMKKELEPDKIFTTSKYNEAILKKKLKNKLNIYNAGSLKNVKKIKTNKKKFKFNKIKNILVMPEGIPSEIELFLTYCINNNHPSIKFNFRLHPIFKNNQSLKKYNFYQNSNIKFSESSLSADFNKNQFILYRGTAGVIDAINCRLIPIYLYKQNEITLDPLYNLNRYHKINFKNNLINYFRNLNDNKFKSEREKLYSFTKNYYSKFNFKLIKMNLN